MAKTSKSPAISFPKTVRKGAAPLLPAQPKAIWVDLLFATTIFVGAFLLFQIQPLIGKYILPWFGGTPAVWTTCMLFFQIVLLMGYAYAHASVKYLNPRSQMIVHLILLIAAICMLPVIPSQRWVPTDPTHPIPKILGLLTASVGLPYLALAATGPLLQAWFGRLRPGKSPYRLYALSNVASLLALVSYPFFFEPTFTRIIQARMWGFVLIGFGGVCAATAIIAARARTAAALPNPIPADRLREKLTRGDLTLWILLPACASSMFLAVTNKLCEDIAVIPLLWVLPLGIYLLSFIISFDSPRWYARWFWMPLMGISLTWLCWELLHPKEPPEVLLQIAMYSIVLFACCMVCHGELYRLRPGPIELTSYYLLIAAGGAIGGVAVGIVAPLTLERIYELNISLVAAAALTLLCLARSQQKHQPIAWGLLMTGLIVLAIVLGNDASGSPPGSSRVMRSRTFYGVLTVYDLVQADPYDSRRNLLHGETLHGFQFLDIGRRMVPGSYYSINSGLGRALANLPPHGPLRVGVVGLGAGTVLTYAQPGDVFRVYEINPEVLRLAHEQFTFLADCKGKVEVALGDARISLQHEPPQQFDVIILDAFSGDAIPVHLLTRECFELYLQHLKPGGIIAIHISNKYLDLAPVVVRLAEHFKLGSLHIVSPDNLLLQEYMARWMLVTSNQAWLDSPAIRSAATPVNLRNPNLRLWTDDDTNLFQILFSW